MASATVAVQHQFQEGPRVLLIGGALALATLPSTRGWHAAELEEDVK